MPSKIQAALVALAFAAAAGPIQARAAPLTIREFDRVAQRCGPSVAPSTLASIARTESTFEPLSINDNNTGRSDAPATRDIAIQIASKLLEAGHSIDTGIMQINSGNFAKLGLTLQGAFDPCLSVAAGAAILTGDYAGGETHEGQQSALRIALSRYNTGDARRGFENGYVHKVELAAGRIVPALDVGAAPTAVDIQHPTATASSGPVDPNAPPSWDVWSSFDYAAIHSHDKQAPAPPKPAPSSDLPRTALLADAGQGTTAAAAVSVPAVER
jgi:type IV secretion system protein VirB1